MIYVGIDISKSTLDVFFNNKHKKWANTQRSIDTLIQSLPEDAYVIFESSGPYTKMLYQSLYKASIEACCANPLQIRRFAQGFGQFAKTDKIDAKVLASYGEIVQPQPTEFMNDVQLELNELMYVREVLRQDLNRALNRLETPFASELVTSVQKEVIQVLKTTSKEVALALKNLMKRHADYDRKMQLLLTIPGIGPLSAYALLAYCPELGQITNKQISALVGLAARTCQSGKMRMREKIGGGRQRARTALYMPAIATIRGDGHHRPFYLSLVQRGKAKKQAITAVMRKNLVEANCVIRRGTSFEKREKQLLVDAAA